MYWGLYCMGRKSKRLFAGIFALFFALSAWENTGFLSLAAERTSVTKMWAASVREVGEVPQLWPGLQHKKVQYAMIDGETAYCMNYGLRGYKGLAVTGSGWRTTALSGEQEKRLLYCLYYGFAAESEGRPNQEEACAYIATQAMVWNITSGIFGGETADAAAGIVCASAPDPDQAFSKYVDLKRQVEHACGQRVPSFAASEAAGAPVYELCWNSGNQRYELTLEDTNGALDDFALSLSGYEVQKEQGRITISTQEAQTVPTQAVLQSDLVNVVATDSCVYWLTGLEGYQEFVSERPIGSPLYGFFQVKTEPLGAITVCKEGEQLTGWDGSRFVYETCRLPGAVFRLTAQEDIFRGNSVKEYEKGEIVADQLVTGEDGQVTVEQLPPGTYQITELQSIPGFTIDSKPRTVKIEHKDQKVEVQYEAASIYNARQTALVSVKKKDEATKKPLAGGQYTLYAGNEIKNRQGQVIVTEGTALETAVTGADGIAVFSVDLPVDNSYYIKETRAPEGYVRDTETIYRFSFEAATSTKETMEFAYGFFDERVVGSLRLRKRDRETGQARPQGNASLKDAVYGLYARETVYLAADVLYQPDELVATLTTDENGCASVDNLYLGKYYLKELTPPKGYVLDETEYEVALDYLGDLVTEVQKEITVSEQVKEQPFGLIKVADDGQATEGALLAGAGFQAYLKSSLRLKPDGGYDFDRAEPIALGADGATTIYTDERGQAVSVALPYGVYVVVETVTPHNMKTISPFEVTIEEHHPTEPQQWRVFLDRSFRAKLRIIKKDGDTGRTVLIPGAEFKIFNLDTGAYVVQYTTYPSKVEHTSFFTDEDGDLILPETLPVGNYRIEEVTAPAGYVRNKDHVVIAVDTDTAYRVDEDTQEAVIEVEYVNAPTVGQLRIEKRGEVLKDFEKSMFLFQEMPLAGAKFEIYAAEDIYTADGQTDESGVRTCYYRKGDLVATLVTGADGQAVLAKLPLGTYRVVEVEAPYGYVAGEKEQLVTLAYADDETPVIYANLTVSNAYQKARVSVKKTDAKDGRMLPGAVLGLYAAEDILADDGTVIVKKDAELGQAVTGEDGIAVFVLLLPMGRYYVKELQAPAGYVRTDESISVEASYQAQGQAVLELTAELTNAPVEEPPKTGDEAAPWLYAGMCLSSTAWLLVSGWRRRRK